MKTLVFLGLFSAVGLAKGPLLTGTLTGNHPLHAEGKIELNFDNNTQLKEISFHNGELGNHVFRDLTATPLEYNQVDESFTQSIMQGEKLIGTLVAGMIATDRAVFILPSSVQVALKKIE